MLNMGLERLVLAAPECDPLSPEAERMARDAKSLLLSAVTVSTLDEALADFHYAVASTARRGKRRGDYRTPREAAPGLIERAEAGERIALVFGPEDRGLSAGHLSRCQEVVTIPTAGFKSLNLAQAVLVVAYELFLAASGVRARKKSERAPLSLQEALFADLKKVLPRPQQPRAHHA